MQDVCRDTGVPVAPADAASGASDGLTGFTNLLNENEVDEFRRNFNVGSPSTNPCFLIDWTAVAKEVSEHPRVHALAEAAAQTAGSSDASAAVKHKAAAMARNLGVFFSPRHVSVTCAIARVMFHRLYAGIIFETDQLVALTRLFERAHKEGRSVVVLPSHKSHIDYIVLQFVLFRLGLWLPAIAAGDNLNIPLVGGLLRRDGAFFIRRTFAGPDRELYSAVVSAYLEGLLRRGANIQFFPEGGRSRSGKLLQPKIGMLGMVLDPILSHHVEDAYILPVSIHYDRVMETRTYVTELLGAKKRRESLLGVLQQGRHMMAMPRMRYGNIHVRLAPGFSARSYVDRHIALQRQTGNRPNYDPRTSNADNIVLLKALAYHVLDEINRVSSVTLTALVGMVFLCTLGRGVGRADLIRKVEQLRKKVLRSGGHISRFIDASGVRMEDVVDSAVAVLRPMVVTVTGLLEPVYCIAPGRHFELSYYRNMCVHVFIHQAIIAAVLHRYMQQHPDAVQVRRDVIMKDVRFLSRLLKLEFVFSGAPHCEGRIAWGTDFVTTALMRNFETALELMVADGVVEVSKDDTAVILLQQLRSAKITVPYELWSTHFTFLCSLVWPVIESYWLVLAGLSFMFRHSAQAINEAELMVRLHAFAKTLVHLGHVHYHEAASVEALRKALSTYSELEIVRWVERTDEEGNPTTTLQLGPDYEGSTTDGLSRFTQCVEKVASYRRRWLEQEGLDDYPEYIARLAFGVAKL